MSSCAKGTACRARIQHVEAGIVGGVVSTVVLHPLDLLKTRFAAENTGGSVRRYAGLGASVRMIMKREGVTGFYKGVVPNMVAAGGGWGVYFVVYQQIKESLSISDNDSPGYRAGMHLYAASVAGVVSMFSMNPAQVVKTRLCLQQSRAPQIAAIPGCSPAVIHYTGMVDALKKVYIHEGVKGLYKGWIPGLGNVIHGSIQFMAYEEMKSQYQKKYNRPKHAKLEMHEYLALAATSKSFAAIVTYPFQLIRTRLQDHRTHYDGVKDVMRKTWIIEGAKGFYRGLMPYLIHVTPNICLVFLIYEKITART
jgi:solute carrier family 25 folate transporter 32